MTTTNLIDLIPNWFIQQEGNPEGPYTLDQVRDQLYSGLVDADTKVWCEGWESWKSAGECDEFQATSRADVPSSLSDGENDWWHVVEGDTSIGPFSTNQLASKISAGELGQERWVLKNGWENWKPIERVAQFRHLLLPLVPATAPVKKSPEVRPAYGNSKGIVGSMVVLFAVLWLFSGDKKSDATSADPEAAFKEIARRGDERMRAQDGKACHMCAGSGQTGKLKSCPDCKDPRSFAFDRRSLGTRTTPSGYVIVCTTCSGGGLIPESCSICRGSGIFQY